MAKEKAKKKSGRVFTKTITRGPNKGDRVSFKVAKGGHPYPTRVISDKGNNSTLRDNTGVDFGNAPKARGGVRRRPV